MRSKKALKNILAGLIQQLITAIYGFIVPKIIIDHFGSETNGLVSSITQFLGYITLLESGFGPVVKSVLYKPLANKNNQKITDIILASEKFFKKISYFFIIYLLGLVFLYPIIINSNFDYIFTASMVLIISISTFAEYYFGMAYRLFLQADQKSYIVSIIQSGTYILSTFLVVILAKFNMPIHIIKLATAIAFVIRPIAQNIYVKKKYNINLKTADKNFKIEQKWDGLIQHIASVIHENTDIAILTLFSSLTEVSIYSVYILVLTGIKNTIRTITNSLSSTFGNIIAKKEKNTLNKRFNGYETIYLTSITIIYTCTILLIVPFIQTYTNGTTDANYVQWAFGILITIADFIWAIRLSYSTITLAAGHFKETRKGAWVEAGTNIILSIILVWKFGLIGVAIGTLVAMLIRTIEFIYHTNKHILERNIWKSVQKIIIAALETSIIAIISHSIPMPEMNSYLNWIIYALKILATAIIIVIPINFLLYKNDFRDIIKILKRVLKRSKK